MVEQEPFWHHYKTVPKIMKTIFYVNRRKNVGANELSAAHSLVAWDYLDVFTLWHAHAFFSMCTYSASEIIFSSKSTLLCSLFYSMWCTLMRAILHNRSVSTFPLLSLAINKCPHVTLTKHVVEAECVWHVQAYNALYGLNLPLMTKEWEHHVFRIIYTHIHQPHFWLYWGKWFATQHEVAA